MQLITLCVCFPLAAVDVVHGACACAPGRPARSPRPPPTTSCCTILTHPHFLSGNKHNISHTYFHWLQSELVTAYLEQPPHPAARKVTKPLARPACVLAALCDGPGQHQRQHAGAGSGAGACVCVAGAGRGGIASCVLAACPTLAGMIPLTPLSHLPPALGL